MTTTTTTAGTTTWQKRQQQRPNVEARWNGMLLIEIQVENSIGICRNGIKKDVLIYEKEFTFQYKCKSAKLFINFDATYTLCTFFYLYMSTRLPSPSPSSSTVSRSTFGFGHDVFDFFRLFFHFILIPFHFHFFFFFCLSGLSFSHFRLIHIAHFGLDPLPSSFITPYFHAISSFSRVYAVYIPLW